MTPGQSWDAGEFDRVLGGLLGQPLCPLEPATLFVDWIRTPLGPMIAVGSSEALCLLEFPERRILGKELQALAKSANGQMMRARCAPLDQVEAELDAYFAGSLMGFKTPLAPLGTKFSQWVWQALQTLPMGQTQSYQGFARSLGRPDATRAIARANGANPIAIVIPCHRLIGSNGALTGYGGGLWRKEALLRHEATVMQG